MEVRLPNDKLEKAIKEVAKLLEKRSFTIHEEFQSLDGLLSFAAKVVYPSRAFLRQRYDALAKGGRYLLWSKPIRDYLLWWEKFLLRGYNYSC